MRHSDLQDLLAKVSRLPISSGKAGVRYGSITNRAVGKEPHPKSSWLKIEPKNPLQVHSRGHRPAFVPARTRIDAVLWSGKKIVWVIESEVKLNFEAIGQALYYSKRFIEKHHPAQTVTPAIVCELVPEIEMLETCKEYGIMVWQAVGDTLLLLVGESEGS